MNVYFDIRYTVNHIANEWIPYLHDCACSSHSYNRLIKCTERVKSAKVHGRPDQNMSCAHMHAFIIAKSYNPTCMEDPPC